MVTLLLPVVIISDERNYSKLLGNLNTNYQEDLLVSCLNTLSEKNINVIIFCPKAPDKESIQSLLDNKNYSNFSFKELESTEQLGDSLYKNPIYILSDLNYSDQILKLVREDNKQDFNLANITEEEVKFRSSIINSLEYINSSLKNKIELRESSLEDLSKVLVDKFKDVKKSFNLISINLDYEYLSTLNLINFLKSKITSLLACHVMLDEITYEGQDPIIGWLSVNKKVTNSSECFRVENPFSYFNIGEGNNLNSIEYLPRRLLLSYKVPTVSISLNHLDYSSYQNIPSKIMRQNPDRFGLKLNQKTDYGILSRAFYINGGLGSFGTNSTTGFSLDYWLEEDFQGNDSNINKKLTYSLETSFDLTGNSESFSLRPLLSLGGEGKKLYRFEDADHSTKNEINLEQIEGGLSGVRLIDGSTHLVIDLRLSFQVQNIKIFKEQFSLNGISLKISFLSLISQITSDKPIKSLFVSIY